MSTSERQAELEKLTKAGLSAILDGRTTEHKLVLLRSNVTKADLIEAVIASDPKEKAGDTAAGTENTGTDVASSTGSGEGLGAPQQPPQVTQPPEPGDKVEDLTHLPALPTYDPDTHYVVDRKLFNHMIASLLSGHGTQNYTRMALVTKVGEMFGMVKTDPQFYEKAKDLVHLMNNEHRNIVDGRG